MGKNDEVLKRYLADADRYADLINGFGFGGQQVVHAEDLSPLDTQTGQLESGTNRHRSVPAPRSLHKQKGIRYRDLIRRTAFGMNFAVIGVENQQEVNYIMPVRCMGYDVREYERQAAEARRRMRAEVKARKKEQAPVKSEEKLTSAELLSGIRAEEKLHPCVTFVLFYGDEWTGSKDLHGLLDFSEMPEQMRSLVANYNINLLDIKKLESTDMFRTDLKQVFDFIRYSKDKNKLKELSEQDSSYMEMEEDAYDVAVAFTGAEELVSVKKEEKTDMCQALKELLQEEREEGREEGKSFTEERMNRLIQQLLGEGRSEDLLRATKDKAYLEELCREFCLTM